VPLFSRWEVRDLEKERWSYLVVDKDAQGSTRNWTALLGYPVEVVTIEDCPARLKTPSLRGEHTLVVLHGGRDSLVSLRKEAPGSWIWVVVSGGGWTDQEAAGYETSHCYFRRLPVMPGKEVLDLGFQACWKQFVEHLDPIRSDFSCLDPVGVPDILLAWAMLEKLGWEMSDRQAFDSADLRQAYNSLWDGTSPLKREGLSRLSNGEAPTIDGAMMLVRAARVDS